jgi:hypothetical protein
MKWIEPKYSKRKVRKAGKTLCEGQSSEQKSLREAFVVLLNWRAAHAYPMHCLLMLLRRKAVATDKNAIVVQRLKRLPSIRHKLIRFGDMSLDRMQDIAGCRAVVKNVVLAEKLRNRLTQSQTRHTLLREYDYIKNPKDSGYRGIHLVYGYGGTKPAFKNLSVEVQIRSKIQHSWATAVEVVDTFTKQSLKTSQGQEDWTKFFQVVSSGFSMLEKRPALCNCRSLAEMKKEVSRLSKQLHVREALKAFAVSTRYLSDKKHIKSSDFIMLALDTEKARIQIWSYKQSQLDVAAKDYLSKEREFQGDETKNVVLVATSSIRNLRQAYPNYFADTDDFILNLNKIFKLTSE